jgi:thiol-disulfide isomerase/thioredoxin
MRQLKTRGPETPGTETRNRFAFAVAICAIVVALLIGALFLPAGAAQAQTTAPTEPVVIYFYWGDGCPHCAEAKPFLQQLTEEHPNVEVRAYEVWYVEENREHFWRMASAYGFEPSGVPTIFLGDHFWVGYGDLVASQLVTQVERCSQTPCPDKGIGIIPGIVAPTATALPTENAPVAVAASAEIAAESSAADRAIAESADLLTLPFIGAIDLSTQSLLTSTALIAFVDGFNPCSLWVLSVLLALTLHTGSRAKVFWVGLIFLTVTSLIYALFITGLFTFFTVIGFVTWIQVIVALVALFFALVNIKDYFWYKEGISFTIADEKKPGLYRQMRAVLDAGKSTWGILSATVVLAAGVSLVEFSCTAGFPILWTNLLTAQQATTATFVSLLLVYMLIYQVDELGIFLVSVLTLKASKLEEKHGRMLKLAGGMLMLTLAGVMLIRPSLMSSISTSLWVFLVAFAATVLVLLIHRTLLPRLGIRIGSEAGLGEMQKPAPAIASKQAASHHAHAHKRANKAAHR